MKRADRLISAAFDASEEELARLKAGLSLVESRELDRLRSLKEDLRRASPAPDCELTTEHLRNAILNRGPEPAPARRQFLSWAPVALALGLGLWVVQSKPPSRDVAVRQAPQPSETRQPVAPTSSAALQSPRATFEGPAYRPESLVASVEERGGRSEDRSARAKARRATHRLEVTTADERDEYVVYALNASRESETSAAQSQTEPQGSDSAGPVVVVSESPDPSTGTAQAHEVSRPSDMVFGG